MRTNNLTDSMQSAINQRLWHLIEQHGGVSKVSLKLGVARQTLYNMRDNRALPSVGTLTLIRQTYPNTDINQILSGESGGGGDMAVTVLPVDAGKDLTLRTIIEEQRRELAELRAENRANSEIIRDVARSSVRATSYYSTATESDLKKNLSVSDTTPSGQLLIGFDCSSRRKEKAFFGIRFSDAVGFSHAKRIRHGGR